MKALLAAAVLLVGSSALAWSKNYVDVVNGRTVAVKAVDASNFDGIVSLRVVVKNPAGASIAPVAKVTAEDQGFACDVQDVLLLDSAYDASAKEFTQSYQVKVAWTPGQDWGSCTVQVQHPSLEKNSVVLYTEGDMSSPVYEDRW